MVDQHCTQPGAKDVLIEADVNLFICHTILCVLSGVRCKTFLIFPGVSIFPVHIHFGEGGTHFFHLYLNDIWFMLYSSCCARMKLNVKKHNVHNKF